MVQLPKGIYVILNYGILIAFVAVNGYVTYAIIRTYGLLLGNLFRGRK